jgi:hypothetical protein
MNSLVCSFMNWIKQQYLLIFGYTGKYNDRVMDAEL